MVIMLRLLRRRLLLLLVLLLELGGSRVFVGGSWVDGRCVTDE